MKKVFLAIATLAMSVAVNAIGFDFRTPNPEIYDAAIGSTITNCVNMDVVETSAPTEGKSAGKYELQVVTASVEGSCYVGGIKFSYTNNSNANAVAFKTYGRYIQPNGTQRYLTIPGCKAGDVVVIVSGAACDVDVNGELVSLVVDTEVEYTVKADGDVVIYNGKAGEGAVVTEGKPKYNAVYVKGTLSGVENAVMRENMNSGGNFRTNECRQKISSHTLLVLERRA